MGDVCQDKNECNDPSINCPAGSTCTNTDGSFECNCDEGFGTVGVASSPLEGNVVYLFFNTPKIRKI